MTLLPINDTVTHPIPSLKGKVSLRRTLKEFEIFPLQNNVGFRECPLYILNNFFSVKVIAPILF